MQTSETKVTGQKRTIVAAVMILFCIPLTIAIGILFLNDRSYYPISLMIILFATLPFAMVFESRKPQARELVIIAVLVAIAVAGRTAFFMVPQVKPVIAIVIIAGVSLGAESGFIVGALTGFVSNFIFGQGPWTPWQMFAFGIIGFLAGLLFSKGILSGKTLPLSIFGGLAAFMIYGLLLDTAAVMMFTSTWTKASILSTYMLGVPFNLIHGASTILFLLILSRPMTEKLTRIKKKYGLVEERNDS
ncbi:MAG: ECF transporter S component [Clostridiales Family XIII bacterium]|jgi:energy-coupling factor transport system substrate-specific component|nr:ECF transporter S component [Clostridiales Family XIII bacterium]